MAEDPRLICDSAQLADGGKGIRFSVEEWGETVPAFVIRFNGKVHAYLNQCAHVSVELDWLEGEFFDESGLYLICSTHGALYLPESGVCIGGPCTGKRLSQLAAEERDGKIYVYTMRG